MVNCINTTNGIAGGPVCQQNDITLQLTAGAVITSSAGCGLQVNNTSSSEGTAGLCGKQGTGSLVAAGTPAGVWGQASSGSGVFGSSEMGNGVYGFSTNASGITGFNATDDTGQAAVRGETLSRGNGVVGLSPSGVGVHGDGPGGTGVLGTSNRGVGVDGRSSSASGVAGLSQTGTGVFGASSQGTGILGISNDVGVLGLGGSVAAEFFGNVEVSGTLRKSGGGFKIDHPLDPANKYLSHSFVESPDMKNVYDGVAVLDTHGEAMIDLPAWFEALNKEFRYQLTPIGSPGPNLYIAEEVNNHRFKIARGPPSLKVSWQVTGIRQDAWAQANQLEAEQDKLASERDHYLSPEAYGHSLEKSIIGVRHPEILRQFIENQQRTP